VRETTEHCSFDAGAEVESARKEVQLRPLPCQLENSSARDVTLNKSDQYM